MFRNVRAMDCGTRPREIGPVEMDREQNGPNIISLSLVLSANRCMERQVINKISSLTWDDILQLPLKKKKIK